MKSRRTSRVLLLLAFLCGQAFALAHATQHELLDHGKAACEICTVSHASPVPPAPALLPARAAPQFAPRPAAAPGIRDRRPFARPNTRGPPALLA